MADDNETQIDLGDEHADGFGRLYDPSMEARGGPGRQVLGAACEPGYPAPDWLAGALREQVAAQSRFANKGMRTSLAASLLQSLAATTPLDQWVITAEKALAAAAIIYPDPKEAK